MRRFALGNLIVLVVFGIGVLIFLDTPILALAWNERPFPGFVVEQTLVVAGMGGTEWSGRRIGIEYPQRITHIDGQAVSGPEAYHAALSAHSPGQRIEVRTQLPDGSTRTYSSVELGLFPGGDLFRMFWLPYGIGLAYLAVGLWLYRLRGETAPGRAFAFFCANTAIANGLLFDLYSTHAAPGLWTLAIAQMGGAIISLALVFPEAWTPVKRWPWLRYLPYGVSIGLGIWGLLHLNSRSDPWAYITAWRLNYVYTALGIFTFLGIMLYRQQTNPSVVARQQARIVLWGSALAFLPVGVFLGAPLFGLNVLWNPVLFLPFLILFPLSVSLAILRYRLWDIDVIVNRTLVYGLLTVLLGLVYYASVIILTEVLRAFTPDTSELVAVLATLAIVALFNPLRGRVQSFIDERFYHRKYDVAKTLATFGESLRDEVDLGHLLEQLEAVISETIMPQHVLAWLRTESGFQPHRPDKAAVLNQADANQPGEMVISPLDPLPIQLARSSGAQEIDHFDLDSPALQILKSTGVRIMLPLVSQGELTGWISLGPRKSEQEYSVDDRQLLTNLAMQAAPAVRVAQLVRQQQAETLERERLENEMRVARMIQQSLLPKEMPSLPGWNIGAHYRPARAVGGDFYDFFHFSDGRLGLFIGDVTGKGLPAAMVMATTRSLLRATAQQVISPGQVLQRVNDLLEPDIPPNMFVTCLYALLDPESGGLRFANAGHNLPFRTTSSGVAELRATGVPLGLMPEMVYEEVEACIEPDECVILYSDGLVEAHNSAREMFGSPRLQAVLGQHFEDSQSLIDCLLSALEDFGGEGWEQEDDITLVGIKRALPERR